MPYTNSDTESKLRRAKRPRSILAGPYGHPFHALLVTIPIGAWTASFIFDIVAGFQDDPEPFHAGASLLILVGLIGAVVAAVVGILDLSTLSSGTRVRKIGLTHMLLNTGATLLFLVSLIVRSTSESGDPGALGLVLSIAALVLLGGSGFLGGEMTYRYGVRVADEETQQAGYAK